MKTYKVSDVQRTNGLQLFARVHRIGYSAGQKTIGTMHLPFPKAINNNRVARGLLPLLGCILVMISITLGDPSGAEGRSRAESELLPWHIYADRIVNVAGSNFNVAEGEVIILKGDQMLRADRVVYNKLTGIARAEGRVKLSTAGDVLWCDQGVFNLRDKTGSVINGKLFLATNHYYVRGQEIRKTGPETYIIRGCRITPCDGETPDWSITGSEVRVTIEGYGTVKHAAFYVKRIPFLYFPYIIFPAKTKRQTGLLPPTIGYSSRDGMDFELPLFWAISQQADATIYERYIQKRGVKHGIEFRYITDSGSKGAVLFDILSDRQEDKDMFSEDDLKVSPFPRTNATRYWLRARSDQGFPGKIVSRFDVDFVSDYDYLREFQESSLGFDFREKLDESSGRPLDETHAPLRRSAVRFSRDFQDYSFQALSSYYQNPRRPDEDETAQPLAGLEMTMLPKKVFDLPFFFSLDTDYGYIYRDSGQKGQRVGFSPSLSYPLWAVPYLEIEPSLKYLVAYQWFEGDGEERDEQSKDAYELGLEVSTALSRVFALESGSVKSLKHKIQPTFSYTYRPYQDSDQPRPWFEPVDTLGRLNSVSFSLENFINARREDKHGNPIYSQSAEFTLSQSYDLDEARKDLLSGEERQPFGPLKAKVDFTPYPEIDLSATARWDHYEQEIYSWNGSLDLVIERSGNREDRYSVDFDYDSETERNLNYEVEINVVYGFSVGAQGKRDLMAKYAIENSYWIDYQSQCWGVRLAYENVDEERRVMFLFRLSGIGEVRGLRKTLEE